MDWFEVAHQIGLLPILGMLIWRRNQPQVYWFVAWAFFVSWFADSAMHFIGGTWQAGYFWLPIQTWLVLLAFVRSPVNRLFSLIALSLLAIASIALSWPGPDYLITIVGSLAILSVARGKLAIPIHIYFGYGTVAYIWMASEVGGNILPAWYTYQACRLLAFITFLAVIAPPLSRRWRA